MAIMPITVCGDTILRKKGKKVSESNNKLVKLITDMFETMRSANGIGLAANQVGSNKSIFIVDISPVEGYEDTKPIVFINPNIVERSIETSSIEEGCLSLPDLRAEVIRPKRITIDYEDTDLKKQSLEADDLLARVIQHEYDHLQGILFTDLVDEETKKMFKKPLNKIKKRKIDVDYPISDSSDYKII